jgi:hypothetical protein
MLQHKASDRFLAIRQNLNGLSTTEIDVWVHAIVDDNKKRQDYNIAVEGVTYETRIHIAATLMAFESAQKEERVSQRSLEKTRAANPYATPPVALPIPENSLIEIGPGATKEIVSEKLIYEEPPKPVTQAVYKTMVDDLNPESIELREAALEYRSNIISRIVLIAKEEDKETIFLEVDPPTKRSAELPKLVNGDDDANSRYSIIHGKKHRS